MIPLILASASPARRAVLAAAGVDAACRPTDVDEARALASALAADPALPPSGQVLALARAKAEAAASLTAAPRPGAARPAGDGPPDGFILGCDSMLELDGRVLGKPANAAEATERIRQQVGRTGTLLTGHWLIGCWPGGTRGEGASSATEVRFGPMTNVEIEAYVATGEPLRVAGAFTIDQLGGPFIDGLDGDPHGVVGLSLPTLRRLLGAFGVGVQDLWRAGLRQP